MKIEDGITANNTARKSQTRTNSSRSVGGVVPSYSSIWSTTYCWCRELALRLMCSKTNTRADMFKNSMTISK